MKNLLEPWKRIVSVERIDLDNLLNQGITLILIDRDNTCVDRAHFECSPEVLSWFHKAHEKGFSVCLLSNNTHSDEIQETADLLGCQKIDHAMKPLPIALKRAMKRYGVRCDQTVMIGDQYFTDVLAGNLSHVKTILVKPLSEIDLWYTKFFRKVERHFFATSVFED